MTPEEPGKTHFHSDLRFDPKKLERAAKDSREKYAAEIKKAICDDLRRIISRLEELYQVMLDRDGKVLTPHTLVQVVNDGRVGFAWRIEGGNCLVSLLADEGIVDRVEWYGRNEIKRMETKK